MKTITVTTHDRPELLERMLVTLCENWVHEPGDLFDHYQLFAQCEPGCPAAPAIIDRYVPSDRSNVSVNTQRLGVRDNPRSLLQKVFEAGSEQNIYLEEDIILAPDAIRLAEWYWQMTSPRYLCLNFLIYESDATRPADVLETVGQFNALGLCLTRDAWEEHFLPVWYVDVPGFAHGWDWSVHRRLRGLDNLFTLQPALSRSNHTGRIGTHCRPKFHDMTFPRLAVNSDPGPFDYRLVPVV